MRGQRGDLVRSLARVLDAVAANVPARRGVRPAAAVRAVRGGGRRVVVVVMAVAVLAAAVVLAMPMLLLWGAMKLLPVWPPNPESDSGVKA